MVLIESRKDRSSGMCYLLRLSVWRRGGESKAKIDTSLGMRSGVVGLGDGIIPVKLLILRWV